jgi:G protein-coupled receptor GPR1
MLFLVIHGALLIFKPTIDPYNPRQGLEAYRVYVNIILFALPSLLASLAFVIPQAFYISQGAFCSLPVRPLWVRLSLSWIPRYVVFVTTLALTMTVYMHVRTQISSFRRSCKPSITSSMPLTSEREDYFPSDLRLASNNPRAVRSASLPAIPSLPTSSRRTSRVSTDMHNASRAIKLRRLSLPDIPSLPMGNSRHQPQKVVQGVEAEKEARPSGSKRRSGPLWTSPTWIGPIPEYRRESKATTWTNQTEKTTYSSPGILSFGSSDMMLDQPKNSQPTRSAKFEKKPRGTSQLLVHHSMESNRKLVAVQLRLMFLYPLVYIALWTIPFILHCMQFSDKYARASLPVLSALSSFCEGAMGGAMCVVFMVREKPWRARKPFVYHCCL